MGTPPISDDLARQAADAFREYGDKSAAARALGLTRNCFRGRLETAARRGMLGTKPVLPGFEIKSIATKEGDSWVKQTREAGEEFAVPDGHIVKGVSALLDADGRTVQQWVKTREGELDPLVLAERIKEIFKDMDPAAIIAAPAYVDEDLLTIYPIADAHIGMYASRKETGEAYDTDIAVSRLRDWIGRLVASSPASKEAVILDVGDMLHADDERAETPRSKHKLDVDGRYFRTLEMTIAAMADSVELALAKHSHVHVVIIAGNHNPHSFMAILFAIAERYRDNPRVTVRKDPREFWSYRFGECLLAAHHGDKAKAERLVMFLADEYAEDWGQTKHRYIWTGHLHHHRSADIGGVRWEQLRAMTARDAYAYTHAYSSRAQLQAITLHRKAGEIQRQAVSSYSV
ncbi:MAG: hypothetical protein E5X94_00505 [Mesorhizobium sp.]|uniref:hypothetical protein n=1 Tax=Mesorhizobium sp. TaxID=1871066 RepID=UPI00122051E2|nr:hypothetical protein [Mesorhizobium sp.]TIN82736.1 MAG: hypothetical protein E5X97_28940 [Mesorhizobium sp.]TIN88320.1 MAG: hypothetical protein E5X94_00505 [Mesorhizobium sp.]